MSGTTIIHPFAQDRNLGVVFTSPHAVSAHIQQTLLTPLPVFPQSHSAPALLAAFLFLRHAELIPLTSKVLPSDTLVKLTSARGHSSSPLPLPAHHLAQFFSEHVFSTRCFLVCSLIYLDVISSLLLSHHPPPLFVSSMEQAFVN